MDDMTISIKTAIEAKWTLKEIRAYQLDQDENQTIKVEKSGAEEKKGRGQTTTFKLDGR